MTSRRFGTLAGIIALLAVGCGSEDPGSPFQKELKGESGGSAAPGGDVEYVAGPYGYDYGSIVPNLHFLGWKDPMASGFDTAALEPISIADFRDNGVKLLHINLSAIWCAFCKAEHEGGTYQLADGSLLHYNKLVEEVQCRKAAGYEYLEAMVQDNEGGPATRNDLKNWAEQYEMSVPFVLDGDDQLSPLRGGTGFPANIVIDTTTMRIIQKIDGADDGMWDWIDDQLGGMPAGCPTE